MDGHPAETLQVAIGHDGDEVLVTDPETGIVGAGPTLAAAKADLHAMEIEHLEALESHADGELSDRLVAMRDILRRRYRTAVHGHAERA